MANPNIVGVQYIRGRTANRKYVKRVSRYLIRNNANSNEIIKINTITATNTSNTSQNLTVQLVTTSGTSNIISNIVIPRKTTLNIIQKNHSIYLEEDSSINVFSTSINDAIGIYCSYEQISTSVTNDRFDIYDSDTNIVTTGIQLYVDADNSLSYSGTGSTWNDLSSSARNGTLVSSPTFTNTGSNSYFTFNGSNQNVSFGTFMNFPVFTISIWCYPGSTQIQYADIFDNNHTGSTNFVLQQDNLNTNTYGFGVNGSPANRGSPTFTLPANQWVNLTFTHDANNQIGYINGVQFYSTLGNTPSYSSPNLYLARWGGGGRWWNGRISLFKIYNRVLSEPEVRQNFNAIGPRYGFSEISGPIVTSNTVLRLDAANTTSYPGSGTTWFDLSGNSTNGTLVNGTSFVDTYPKYFNFDGANDTVDFTFDLRTSWTFQCWVMHNVVSGFGFLGQGSFSNNAGLHIWFQSASSIRFGMYANDTDFSVTPSTGIWYNYAFTYDHNSPFTKQVYVNGVAISGTPQQTQSQYSGTGTVRIGTTYSTGINYANGRFSNVLLYNRILTPTEISQNYNALKSRFEII